MSEEAQDQQAENAAKPVEFSPEQQAKVNELIDKAHAKALGKAEKQMSDLRAELEALKADKSKKTESTFDEAAAKKLLAETEARYQAQITQMLGTQKSGLLMTAAAKANAVNPEVVAKLVGDSVVYEDGKWSVQVDGKTVTNARLEPMTVDEFIAKYLDENPYLKRAANAGGAGSSTRPGGSVTGNERAKTWDQAVAQLAQKLR